MNLSSFVNKDLVTVNLHASTKRAVIAEIIGHIASRLRLRNKAELLQSVLEREEKASTGIGDGVAIPHSRLPHLDRVLFFVGISKPGIDFGAPDGKAVHIIFLFVTPEAESQTHLKILSAIGNLQKNSTLLNKLIDAKSDSDLFNVLNYEQVQRESYHPLSRDEIFRELDTSEAGLTDREARERLAVYGWNRLHLIGTTPLLGRYFRGFIEPSNLLLWFAAGMSFAFGYVPIALIVVALVLLNAGCTFLQEYKGETAVDALRNFVPQTATVIREGRIRRVETESVVPGDILLLEKGDIIPADGRLIETEELRVDNSAFSGDPKPVYKSHEPVKNREQYLWIEMPALVFAGTTVIEGKGKAVATSTGMDTELGQIAYLTQTITSEPSSLRKGIDRFAKVSALFALALLVVVGVYVLLARGFGGRVAPFSTLWLVATGIVLGLSPEGLIPGVTLVLLSAARRMRARGAQIKRLSSIETLGNTEVICTDKTGTLTTSEMCVRKLWMGGKIIEVGGEGYSPDGEFRQGRRSIPGVDLGNSDYRILFYDAALCNNARLLPPSAKVAGWQVEGDSTEGALLALVWKAGIDVDTIRTAYPAIRRFPFDSVRKRMSTVHAIETDRADRSRLYLLTKGAPHELLQLSTKIFIDGKERTLDEELRSSIDRQIDQFAAAGMRVLGFAYRRLSKKEVEESSIERIERQFVFMGVTAMFDPPRPDAHEAIEVCHRAGIRVIMITGEYQLTALSIARKLGIVERPDAKVVSGRELSEMTDEQIQCALENKEIVFARVNPEHRLRIVSILQQMGKLVAVTGDGISDAPVLKRADIGVAMGGRGNPVTRASAEMVLNSDSFASIVAAIEEGRAVGSGVKKMISYLSSHLVPEAVSFLAFLFFNIPLPLALSLLLLIDLLIDLVPALAIGMSPPSRSTMQGPREKSTRVIVDKSIVGRDLLFNGLLVTVAALAGFVLTLKGGNSVGVYPTFDLRPGTVFLLGIIGAQLALFALLLVRSMRDYDRRARRVFVFGIAALCSLLLVAAVSYATTLSPLFHTAPLSLRDWAIGIAAFAVVYAVSELRTVAQHRRASGASVD